MTFYLRYLGPGFDSRHLHQLINNMKKLFENFRRFINEEKPPSSALADIEDRFKRASPSWEEAGQAAKKRKWGTVPKNVDPIKGLMDVEQSRLEDELRMYIAAAGATSLLALSFAAPAAAGGAAAAAGTSAGQVTIPTWMGPNANFFFKALQPHPARLHIIIKTANYIVRTFGWSYTVVFSTIFTAYTATFTAMAIDVWLGQALYGKSYTLELIGDVVEYMKNGLGYGESTMKVFSEKLQNGESPKQIASFLKEVHKMYEGLQSA